MYRGILIHIISIMIIGMMMFINTACSSGGGSTTSQNISGVVQKGYFVDGEITAYEVESDGSLSKKFVSSPIGKDGTYKLVIPWKGYSFLTAKGHFFNEYTGAVTEDPIELHALVETKEQKANLNLFSSLEAKRIVDLLQKGKAYPDALADTKDEMERLFGLSKDVNSKTLDIFATEKDENVNLLLLSATFLKVLEETPEKADKYTLASQRLYEDFKADGAIDDLFKEDWEKIINDDEEKTLSVVSSVLGKNDLKIPDSVKKWAKRLRVSVSNPAYVFEDRKLKEIHYTISLTNSSLLPVGARYVIEYETQDLTAHAGEEFTAVSGRMNFSNVTNSYSIVIPVISQPDSDKELNLHFTSSSTAIVLANPDIHITIPKRDISLHASNITIDQFSLNTLNVDGYRFDVGSDDTTLLIGSENSDATLTFSYRATSLIPTAYFVDVYAMVDGEAPLLVKEDQYIPTVGNTITLYWQISAVLVPVNDSLRLLFERANSEAKDIHFKVVVKSDESATVEKLSATMPKFVQISKVMQPHTEITTALFKAPMDASCQNIEEADFSAESLYALMDIDGVYQLDGMDSGVGIHYDDVCVRLDKNSLSHSFDLTLVDGYGSLDENIYISLGDNELVIDVDKVRPSKVEVSSIDVVLPEGHSIHTKEADGSLNPRGLPYIHLRSNIELDGDSNLSDLVLSGELDGYYLHAKALPFAFILKEYKLDSEGFIFDEARVYYIFSSFNRHTHNAEVFSKPTAAGVRVALTKDGLSSSGIDFMATDSELSFPRVESQVGAFSVELDNSVLKELSSNTTHTIVVNYLQNCYNSECSATPETQRLQIDTTTSQLFSDGSFIASKEGSLGSEVAWGSKDGSVVFTRPSESDAAIFLGGFVLPTNDASLIGSYLLGSVVQDSENLLYFSTDSDEAKAGKNLFAGVNFGNFTNLDLSSMKDKEMIVSVGEGSLLTLNDSEYSKYYIRPSGITGVFNPQDESSHLRVYGYDMYFESFKFAQVENSIDPYTKINGMVHVEGKGDFDVLFTNLELECSGNLGGGKISDEQGHVILDAWKMDSILTTIDFRNKDNQLCSNQRSLELGHLVKIAAYKNRVGLNTFWSSVGYPFDSRVISATYNQLDGERSLDNSEDNGGYNVAIRSIAFRSAVDGLQSRDWVETNSSFGLPFWGMHDMSVRLQNKTTTEREPTVVTAKGELYKDNRLQTQTNEDLIADIAANYQHNVDQKWANVIEFSLPVYYNATQDTSITPLFLGRKLSSDLVVLQADAGINYITPKETKMSFGASADFEKIKGLDLHIDLNDPQSIKNIDASLQRYLGIEHALEDTVGVLVENISLGNRLLREGMTLAMEETALLALKAASSQADPFEKVSQINAELHALPATLKDRMTEMFSEKLSKVFDTNYHLSIEQKSEIIRDFLNDYDAFVAYLQSMEETLDALPTVTTDEMKEHIYEYAFGATAAECSYENFTQKGFFEPIDRGSEAIANVNEKLQNLELSKIEALSNLVSAYTGFDAADLVATAQKVKLLSNDIDGYVSDVHNFLIDSFDNELCSALERGVESMDIVSNQLESAMEMKAALHDSVEQMLTHLQSDEVTEIIGVLKEFDQQENLVDIDINVTNTIVAPLSATLDTLATNIAREIPNIDADDMRRIVVSQIFQLDAVQNFNIALAEKLTPVADELNKLSLVVFNGFDRSITNMLAKVNDKVNEALSSVTSTLDEIPLSAASMDGYGVFYGDSLAKVHVASSFSITGNEKENSFGFSAALDIVNEAISDESGCSSTSVEKANLRATVSTRDIAMPLGEKELKVDLLLLGVTISGDGEVKGVFGAITSKSGFGYDTFSLYDLGLATGIGEEETYLGAKASARMDSVQLGVSFLVGQVCNRMIVASIIPKAINEFITIPNNRFNGALVFGEGQMPIYTNGCTLTVIARAKVGTWFLFGPPKTFGGIVGGGAFGKALCIATLGGEVEVLAEKSGDVVRFKGSGWGAAGVGSCDSSWSSVSDSRSDSWCGTGDARFGASYDNGWSLEKIRTSAVH